MNRIIIIIVSAILATVAVGMYRISKYKNRINTIIVSEIDLTKVVDGEYEGFYDLDLVSARVKVVVKNHIIEEIVILEHKYGKGKNAETILQKVISKQKINVNTVTGATVSSKVLLKAIEDALRKGVGSTC